MLAPPLRGTFKKGTRSSVPRQSGRAVKSGEGSANQHGSPKRTTVKTRFIIVDLWRETCRSKPHRITGAQMTSPAETDAFSCHRATPDTGADRSRTRGRESERRREVA